MRQHVIGGRALLWGSLLVALALGAGFWVGANVFHPKTQVVAVCDPRGNTVYTTSAGAVFVIAGCR